MTEHPTKSELDEYCRRVLAPATFLSVHRHVITCVSCAAQCNSPQQSGFDLVHLHEALVTEPDGTPYHLSGPEMVAYAKGALDEVDLEIAESHLGICPACLSEVQRQAAEGKPVAPTPIESATSRPRERVSLSLMRRWQPWRVAAVVSCGIILILLTIWLLRTKPAQNREQAANLSSPQSSPAVQVAGTPEVLPDAQLALVLNDGNQKVTMDKQGKLAGLERLPSPIQEKIRVALQTGKLEQPSALAQLGSRPSTLLGESGNGLPFRLISPLGQVVRSEQPTFRWRALAGAQSYTVTVTDADLNEIATSPPLNTTEWRISKPLREGGIYSWQVTALKDGVKFISPVLPAPQAKLKIIDRSTSEMLQQAKGVYPNSHLTLGVLYAEAGLLDEAEQELRVLVRNNPRADIANKLLRQIRSSRAQL